MTQQKDATLRERTLKAARNQSLFREINERIAEVNRRVGPFADGWVCECLDTSCAASIEMSMHEYERLRSHPNHFAVTPGHEQADVEDVVEQCQGYLIVAKRGSGAEYATAHDPRAGRSRAAKHPRSGAGEERVPPSARLRLSP